MQRRALGVAVHVGFMLLLVVGIRAEAAALKVLSAIGMQVVMEDLGPKFERATGHTLALTIDATERVVKRVHGGETADVIVLPRQGIDGLVKDGKAAAGTVTAIAQSGIGLAVRQGAPKPDIASPDALKRTLLAAKSITYNNPESGAASGVHFAKVLERLGIADAMKPKTVFPKLPGTAGFGREVLNGEADIAINQIQVLMTVPGLEVVGPLPGDLQNTLVFAAAMMDRTTNRDAAQALIQFLRTPEVAAMIKAKGMEPATP
jgi:molybdate transport system substrate-binding protein